MTTNKDGSMDVMAPRKMLSPNEEQAVIRDRFLLSAIRDAVSQRMFLQRSTVTASPSDLPPTEILPRSSRCPVQQNADIFRVGASNDLRMGVLLALAATPPNILIDDIIKQLENSVLRLPGESKPMEVGALTRVALESEARSILWDFAERTTNPNGAEVRIARIYVPCVESSQSEAVRFTLSDRSVEKALVDHLAVSLADVWMRSPEMGRWLRDSGVVTNLTTSKAVNADSPSPSSHTSCTIRAQKTMNDKLALLHFSLNKIHDQSQRLQQRSQNDRKVMVFIVVTIVLVLVLIFMLMRDRQQFG